MDTAFVLGLGRRVDEYSSEVGTESPLEIITIPNRLGCKLVKPAEWDLLKRHGEKQRFNIIITSG
jgi:hypothetical protein